MWKHTAETFLPILSEPTSNLPQTPPLPSPTSSSTTAKPPSPRYRPYSATGKRRREETETEKSFSIDVPSPKRRWTVPQIAVKAVEVVHLLKKMDKSFIPSFSDNTNLLDKAQGSNKKKIEEAHQKSSQPLFISKKLEPTPTTICMKSKLLQTKKKIVVEKRLEHPNLVNRTQAVSSYNSIIDFWNKDVSVDMMNIDSPCEVEVINSSASDGSSKSLKRKLGNLELNSLSQLEDLDCHKRKNQKIEVVIDNNEVDEALSTDMAKPIVQETQQAHELATLGYTNDGKGKAHLDTLLVKTIAGVQTPTTKEQRSQEVQNTFVSYRMVDIEQLEHNLELLGLIVNEIKSDGHSLSKDVAGQMAATHMWQHASTDHALVESLEHYCRDVEATIPWRGRLELVALVRCPQKHNMTFSGSSPDVEMWHYRFDSMEGATDGGFPFDPGIEWTSGESQWGSLLKIQLFNHKDREWNSRKASQTRDATWTQRRCGVFLLMHPLNFEVVGSNLRRMNIKAKMTFIPLRLLLGTYTLWGATFNRENEDDEHDENHRTRSGITQLKLDYNPLNFKGKGSSGTRRRLHLSSRRLLKLANMTTHFNRWEKDPFFSAAEEVQESADRMQSTYRTWLHAKKETSGLWNIDELRRDLQTTLGTTKWQLEEFEKAVNSSYKNGLVDDSKDRHRDFIVAIDDQIKKVEKSLNESVVSHGKPPKPWTRFDEHELDEFTLFLSGPSAHFPEDPNFCRVLNRDQKSVSLQEVDKLCATGNSKESSYPLEWGRLESTEYSPGHRRSASASADISSWKISVSGDSFPPGPSNDKPRPTPRKVPSFSSFLNTMESATTQLKWPRNGYRKLKLLNRGQEADTLPRSKHVTEDLTSCFERSKSCLDGCYDKQLHGWYGALQRQFQRSQYLVQYNRPVQIVILILLLFCFIVLLAMRST